MEAGLTLSILVSNAGLLRLEPQEKNFGLTMTRSIRASRKLNELSVMNVDEGLKTGLELLKPLWKQESGRIII